jgi:uncharacterized membrane protein YdjX (TVP38/TMEM64 family)
VNRLPASLKRGLAGLSLARGFAALRRGARKIAVIALVILAIFALQKFLPVQAWLQSGTATYQGLGIWGVLLFIVTYVVLVLLFVPGPLLSLTAGMLYGLGQGYVVGAAGSLIAAAIAWFLAKILMRDKARSWVSRYAAFRAIRVAGRKQPLPTLFAVHMCPLFPFPIVNFMLTLAGIRFPLYLFGAWAGMLPGILFYVYVGALGGDLALEGLDLSARDWWLLGGARVAMWITGISATIGFGLLVKRHAPKATEPQEDPPER